MQKSFFRAQDCFAKFLRVTDFRVRGEGAISGAENAGCFVKSKQEYVEALRLLEDLSSCLELKLEFPLENAIVDCIQYGGLIDEVEGAGVSKLNDVEKIVKMYLAYPLQEIRERILRKIYQKLRHERINKRYAGLRAKKAREAEAAKK